MDKLPADVVWRVLSLLRASAIVWCRLVSKHFKRVIDDTTIEEWRRLYHEQVCSWLDVGPSFDWRKAAVVATTREHAVDALCLWNNSVVSVVVPWLGGDDCPLRRGVVRNVASAGCVEFVYDSAFRLRGTIRTCVQRNASQCYNCARHTKRKCLSPRYTYYLRSVASENVDEFLGLRLRKKSQSYGSLHSAEFQ